MKMTFSGGIALLALFAVSPVARADDAWLGVKLAPVPDVLAAHLKDATGAMVAEVMPGSPAEKAGLKEFDVIAAINGQAVKSPDEARSRIVSSKAGETVKLTVIRGTDKIEVEAALGAEPAPLPELKPHARPQKEKPAKPFLGLGTSALPPALAQHLNLKEGEGQLVADVVKDSPAQKAGIETNDIILSIDGKALQSGSDLVKALAGKKPGDAVKVEFIHKGERKVADVALAPWPKDLPGGSWFMPGTPFPPRGGGSWIFPRPFHSRRITIEGPDGSSQSFEIPDFNTEDIFKGIDEQVERLKGQGIPNLKEHLRKALKEFEDKLQDDGVRAGGVGSSSATASSVVRTIENGMDITVKDQDGARTVTVIQDGKKIAEDLPWSKLDTLPKDVRERVEKIGENVKVQLPKDLPAPDGGDKIRA